jgi:hypothetical protein
MESVGALIGKSYKAYQLTGMFHNIRFANGDSGLPAANHQTKVRADEVIEPACLILGTREMCQLDQAMSKSGGKAKTSAQWAHSGRRRDQAICAVSGLKGLGVMLRCSPRIRGEG